MRRYLAAIVIAMSLLMTCRSYAQSNPIVTFGPKFGYTFGSNGGFTAGFEFSYFPKDVGVRSSGLAGVTLDITTWHEKYLSVHIGGEMIIGGALGIDVGPTIVTDKQTTWLGASGILFVGLIAYPYYEFLVTSNGSFQSVGSYIKVPIIGHITMD
jgi:hypothetical protein